MSGPDLLDGFFEQARAVSVGDRDRIELTPDELTHLASDEGLRLRFRLRLRREIQDADLRELIAYYMEGVASREEELSADVKIDVDGVERYVDRIAIAATTAGIAAIATHGGGGAIVLLLSGLVGLAVAGLASRRLRKQLSRRELLAKRVRALINHPDANEG